MAETVYPLGLIWEDAIPDIDNMPNPASVWSLRGNVEDIGSTYVENGLFDDPVLHEPETYGELSIQRRARSAVITGAPASLPSGTTSVRLRGSAAFSYELAPGSYGGYPEIRMQILRTDLIENQNAPGYQAPASTMTFGLGASSGYLDEWGYLIPTPLSPCNWDDFYLNGYIGPVTYPYSADFDFAINFAEWFLPGTCVDPTGTTNPFPKWDNHDAIEMTQQSLRLNLAFLMGLSLFVGSPPGFEVSYAVENLSLELVVTTEALGGVFLNTFAVGGSIVG